jgi:integrase/recombinase XerD
MSPLRPHMIAALHLSGKGARTQEASGRAVRLLAQCYHTSPDRISEPALPRSFLHRTNVDGLAPASMRICESGLRFFSAHVLKRDWHPLSLLRAPTTPHLPAVLRREDGRRLLRSATPVPHQVSLPPVSRLGLRLQDALFLQVSASDGHRLQGHGPRGKGAPDRDVPLPAETRARLRPSWQTHRHPTWLLPATGREQPQRPPAPRPMSRTSVQGACRTAQHRAGLTHTGVAVPTLRHSYATHRLDAGRNPRLLQRSLGHPPRATTLGSLHRPHTGQAEAYARLNARRPGLLP